MENEQLSVQVETAVAPTDAALLASGLLGEASAPTKPDSLAAIEQRITDFTSTTAAQAAKIDALMEELRRSKEPAPVEEPTLNSEELLAQLLNDPLAALNRYTSQREAEKAKVVKAQEASQAEANAKLQALVPDLKLLEDAKAQEEFKAWREADAVREGLYKSSGDSKDAQLRALVLNQFLSGYRKTALEEVQQQQQQNNRIMQAAGPSTKAPAAPTVKTYSRQEIQQLRTYYPEQYLAREAEITAAYRENRVV